MMNTLALVMLLLPLLGCGKAKSQALSPIFQTERLSHEILRLENEEVVCYRYDKGGLSCRYKEE